MLVTRLAPTPSGFLHLGNVAHLILTAWWARAEHGRLLLRIDDFDTARERPEYLADVFDTLDWLDIRPDAGPAGPDDFRAHWSMRLRTDTFRDAARRLHVDQPDVVFACGCSRRELRDGFCVAGCRTAGAALLAGRNALRLHVPAGLTVLSPAAASPVASSPAPGRSVGLDRLDRLDRRGPPVSTGSTDAPQAGEVWPVPPGDHVLWRRDDLPAYHLGSVLVDEELGVTGVLRGADLLPSSALQLHLAGLIPAPGFAAADLRHHALVSDPGGGKLSKSAGAQAVPLARTDALREHVEHIAAELGAPLGIGPDTSTPDATTREASAPTNRAPSRSLRPRSGPR